MILLLFAGVRACAGAAVSAAYAVLAAELPGGGDRARRGRAQHAAGAHRAGARLGAELPAHPPRPHLHPAEPRPPPTHIQAAHQVRSVQAHLV